jgi:hypothetical protein
MPKWLYKFLRKKIYPIQTKQPLYPILFSLARSGYHIKRFLDHMRFLDFSFLTGRMGYYLWKFRIIAIWQRLFMKKYHLPREKQKPEAL